MKKLIRAVLVIVVALFVLSLLKNGILQSVIQWELSKVAHVRVRIGSTNLSLFKGRLVLKNIRIYNPPNFPEPVMLDAPLMAVSLETGALFHGELHILEADLDLKELTVIKNREGRLNVDAVKPKRGDTAGKKAKLQIDKLRLSVGRVVYKDFSQGGPPQVQTFEIGIRDRVYTNIQDPVALVSLVMFETLRNTALSRLVNLDLSAFSDNAGGLLSKGFDALGGGSDQLETAAKGIMSLFK